MKGKGNKRQMLFHSWAVILKKYYTVWGQLDQSWRRQIRCRLNTVSQMFTLKQILMFAFNLCTQMMRGFPAERSNTIIKRSACGSLGSHLDLLTILKVCERRQVSNLWNQTNISNWTSGCQRTVKLCQLESFSFFQYSNWCKCFIRIHFRFEFSLNGCSLTSKKKKTSVLLVEVIMSSRRLEESSMFPLHILAKAVSRFLQRCGKKREDKMIT